MNVKLQFPEKLLPLMQPRRFKIVYGGRGGAKSRTVAGMLVALGAMRPLRILCARETQKSISDSVLQLLEDQINKYYLQAHYRITQTSIIGIDPKSGKPTGTEFLFHGLKHNISNIKSLEGCDIVWVEEAQSVSFDSWKTLIPTIRKDDSNIFGTPSKAEIWITFNPELESDDTYQRFVVNPPPNALVIKINWDENRWFTETMREDMEHLKATNYDSYLNVWEGHCVTNLEGAIYANELRATTAQGRICRVPYDPLHPVQTFWDLGRSDATSIWFAQSVAFEFRMIEYFESSGHDINFYIKELKDRPYVYGCHYLPHDARAKQLGSGRSIEEQIMDAHMPIQIVPKLSIIDGINAARTLFSKCYFDEAKTVDGIAALRHYQWREMTAKEKQFNMTPYEPLHNGASNGSDAFRYMAVAIQEPSREREAALAAQPPQRPLGSSAWMA